MKHSGTDRDFKLNRSLRTKVANAASVLADAETNLWAFCQKLGNELATLILMDDADEDEEKLLRETLGGDLTKALDGWLKALNVCFFSWSPSGSFFARRNRQFTA